jgi:uncharacterized membrane protein YeaQ/YmgE (transglycosylase-associated protein family)
MHVLLWTVVGLGVGWAAGKLMLTSGGRLTSAVVAGLVGALLGGFVMRQLGAASFDGRVNALVAALAGALWLSWATCVVTFARRSDDELHGRFRSDGRVDREAEMLSYSAARESLVEQLLGDAEAHDAERYDEIGRRYGSLEYGLPRGDDQALTKLHVALAFWDDWIDARDRGWQYDRVLCSYSCKEAHVRRSDPTRHAVRQVRGNPRWPRERWRLEGACRRIGPPRGEPAGRRGEGLDIVRAGAPR